jgi:hypothetical protein
MMIFSEGKNISHLCCAVSDDHMDDVRENGKKKFYEGKVGSSTSKRKFLMDVDLFRLRFVKQFFEDDTYV